MTREGIKKCVRLLQLTFPNTYKSFTTEDLSMLIEVWSLQFNGFKDVEVFSALSETIASVSYPPTIAEIKKCLIKEEHENTEDVWRVLLKAGRNDIMYAKEEWEKLPEALKEVTTPQTLVDIGRASDEAVRFIKKDIMASYSDRKQVKRQELLTSFNNVPLLEDK